MRITRINSCSGNTLQKQKRVNFGVFANEEAQKRSEEVFGKKDHDITEYYAKVPFIMVSLKDGHLVGSIYKEGAKDYSDSSFTRYLNLDIAQPALTDLESYTKYCSLVCAHSYLDRVALHEKHPEIDKEELRQSMEESKGKLSSLDQFGQDSIADIWFQ